jgi:diguanylate cyclase (GGDEF)-like protein
LVAMETQAFGCDHAEIGRWLMTQWRLPDVVRAAVGSSHEPSRWKTGADPITETVVKIVALSGVLADVWVMPDTRLAARRAREQAQQILGLDEARLGALLRRVNKTVVEVAPLFGLQVGTIDEVERVVDRVEQIFAQPEGALDDVLSLRSAGAVVDAASSQEAARTDVLTGLGSRARFDAYLAEQFEFAKKVGKPLSIVLCDPDHFDMINQSFGRDAGDRALRAVGALLGERLRYRDLAARYGGEEFALLLTDTHAAGATIVAERLRKKIEDAQHDIGIGDPVRMTISVGCATLDEALTFARPEDLLLAVERALGQAKRTGRNRIATFAELPVAA